MSAFETQFHDLRNTELEAARKKLGETELARWNWEQSAIHREHERDTLRAELEALGAENARLAEQVHKSDGMANEVNILVKENRELRAEVERLTKEMDQHHGAVNLARMNLKMQEAVNARLTKERDELKRLGEQQFDAGVQYSGIVAKLRARVQKLEGALTPFVRQVEEFDTGWDEKDWPVAIRYLRKQASRARAALESGEGAKP